jgi:thiamine-phosphate pyrophosphorylase
VTLPRCHVVTNDDVLARAGFLAAAHAVLRHGGPEVALHVRGPGTGGLHVFEAVSDLKAVADEAGAWLFVNDRVDVALACGARNVQLGARSLPAPVARSLIGEDCCIGVSCHGVDQMSLAARDGADFTFVGTLFPTPSHPQAEGLRIEEVRAVHAASGDRPWIGIGGIGLEQVSTVLASGAFGFAVVRGVWDAAEPGQAVQQYLEALRLAPIGEA